MAGWVTTGSTTVRSGRSISTTSQCRPRSAGTPLPSLGYDDYSTFLRLGSAGDYARFTGVDQLTWWKKLVEHPAYDGFWQGQALDAVMAKTPLKVPTLWAGPVGPGGHVGRQPRYQAMEGRDSGNNRNYLVMGPWRHSQVNYSGSELGALKFDGDTALQFRRDVLKPFFDQYLVDGAPKADTPPVLIYNTGETTGTA